MLKSLSLILPAIIPSWRFFKTIEPSPRVQWMIRKRDDCDADWREFRPRPKQTTFLQMLAYLFWNPERNDDLFVASCAERIHQEPTDHSIMAIERRILLNLKQDERVRVGRVMQFRLVFVHRRGRSLQEKVVFTSHPVPLEVRRT